MSLLFSKSGRSKREDAVVPAERAAFLPISIEAMAQHQKIHGQHGHQHFRSAGDSGQSTEFASSSQNSRDLSPIDAAPRRQEFERYQRPELEDEDDEDQPQLPQRQGFPYSTFAHKFWKRRLPGLFSQRALKVLEAVYDGIDRAILLLGFIALVTGGVTYAGTFVSEARFDPVLHSADYL